MKRNLKKILSAIIALILFCASAFVVVKLLMAKNPNQNISIIASNFAGYDFARAVLNNDSSVSLLLKPGSDAHNFEPTPKDLLDLAKADLFIYNGGESEVWIEKLIASSEIDRSKTLRLMDFVELKEEDEGEEYDEHIWTSPLNAIKLVEAVRDKLSAIYPKRADEFRTNAGQYIERLGNIDESLRSVIAKARRRELIFADRFPFRYFVDDYGLDYTAAFPGCSEQTEASSSTIAHLADKVRSTGAKYVLKIELTSDALAKTISGETGAQILTLYAAHNVSIEDYKRGATYADFWENNIETLRKALN